MSLYTTGPCGHNVQLGSACRQCHLNKLNIKLTVLKHRNKVLRKENKALKAELAALKGKQ